MKGQSINRKIVNIILLPFVAIVFLLGFSLMLLGSVVGNKCSQYNKCDLKYGESYTCINSGGSYCGKYRQLKASN